MFLLHVTLCITSYFIRSHVSLYCSGIFCIAVFLNSLCVVGLTITTCCINIHLLLSLVFQGCSSLLLGYPFFIGMLVIT